MPHLPIRLLVVHCTASPTTTTREQVVEWHLANGWDDIGYHYLIQAGGIVRKGRRDDTPGAHAKGHNTRSLGVSVSGSPSEGMAWDPDQEYQLVLLLTDLCRAHSLRPHQIRGHSELDPENKPLCPGVSMDAVRQQVAVRLAET